MTRLKDTMMDVAANTALDVAEGTANLVGGTAKLAGNTAQGLAPAGQALGALTAETVGLAATTVGITNDFGKQARRVIKAPLDVIISATELTCTPVTRVLRTTTKAINAGFDRIDRMISAPLPAAL